MRFKYRLKRLYVKAVREKKPPEYIARGWALGMCIGCIIPFGFQLYISIPLSFPLKASKLGATLGTLITNPFTIVLIYPVQCWLGSRVLGKSFEYEKLASLLKNVDWTTLKSLGGTLIASFFVGGFLLAAVLTPITYYGMLYMVRKYRDERSRMRRERMLAFLRKGFTPRSQQKDSRRQ